MIVLINQDAIRNLTPVLLEKLLKEAEHEGFGDGVLAQSGGISHENKIRKEMYEKTIEIVKKKLEESTKEAQEYLELERKYSYNSGFVEYAKLLDDHKWVSSTSPTFLGFINEEFDKIGFNDDQKNTIISILHQTVSKVSKVYADEMKDDIVRERKKCIQPKTKIRFKNPFESQKGLVGVVLTVKKCEWVDGTVSIEEIDLIKGNILPHQYDILTSEGVALLAKEKGE
jgi:hypothetical protein